MKNKNEIDEYYLEQRQVISRPQFQNYMNVQLDDKVTVASLKKLRLLYKYGIYTEYYYVFIYLAGEWR